MRTFAIAALICLMAAPAFGGGNPDVKAYIDFDPDTMTHEAYPAPYTTIQAYVCFTDLEMGLTTVSFMLSDPTVDCPGVFAPPSFTNILPGDLAIGSWNTGITLASTECMPPPTVCVGYLTLFYLGGECCIQILDHPGFPRWVVDCNDPGQVDYYCVLSHGSVGAPIDICPPGDCPQGVPDVVVCEPQDGAGNPFHPPTYWYDVTPGSVPLHDFHVEVFDPNFLNYTAIVAPPGWTYADYIFNDGQRLWFMFCDPELNDPIPVGTTARFQFNHNGLPQWGNWVTTNDGQCNPATGVVDRSENHEGEPDGRGYRVHAPEPYVAVENSSWGCIKALYR